MKPARCLTCLALKSTLRLLALRGTGGVREPAVVAIAALTLGVEAARLCGYKQPAER